MTSTLFFGYRTLLIATTSGLLWMIVAYAAAYLTTRRLIYLLMSISGLALIGVYGVIYVLSPPSTQLILLPVITMVIITLWRCFSRRPDPTFPDYAAPRDIMLFRRPQAPAQPLDGLFVPHAAPQRPSRWSIAALTLGLIGGLAVLLRLMAYIINR